MAATKDSHANIYAQVKNNPEILEKRKKMIDELNSKVKAMLDSAPGRKPSWDGERIRQMDKFCLEYEKRCVMWDDENNGFYMLVNWDWLKNQPRYPTEPMQKFDPGWWMNQKEFLKPPLIDPTLADDKLAEWIDSHTMAVHQFLDKLQQLSRDPETGKLVLDDPYSEELKATPLVVDTRNPMMPVEGPKRTAYD